jgi:hypothetical protein
VKKTKVQIPHFVGDDHLFELFTNPEMVRALAEIHHTCTGTTKRASAGAFRQFGQSPLYCLK